METYITLLRGINVSGQKMIKMEELKSHLVTLNFKNIRTYIQSGNIIFETEKINNSELAKEIKYKISKEFGFEVPVIVRTGKEFVKVLKNNPFVYKRNENIETLHVTFLSEKPDQELITAMNPFEGIRDEYSFADDIIYIYCTAGYGNTKLNNNYFEKKLKVTATTRNWKTIVNLTEMAKNM